MARRRGICSLYGRRRRGPTAPKRGGAAETESRYAAKKDVRSVREQKRVARFRVGSVRPNQALRVPSPDVWSIGLVRHLQFEAGSGFAGNQLSREFELPMPDAIIYENQRLPASYANFYISNAHVIVPTFRSTKDDIALKIITECFKDRDVVGIDSTDIIWGLGSFHCLSQQEPAV